MAGPAAPGNEAARQAEWLRRELVKHKPFVTLANASARALLEERDRLVAALEAIAAVEPDPAYDNATSQVRNISRLARETLRRERVA